MNVEDAQEAVGDALGEYGKAMRQLDESSPTVDLAIETATKKLADTIKAYGDARELRSHVRACGKCEPMHQDEDGGPFGLVCGTGDPIWYCPDVKQVTA